MGFGPVVPEANEPVFHHRWEGRVRSMVIAMGGVMGANIDEGRFAREDVAPREYLSKSYYEIWYAGLVRMMIERGFIASDEIATGSSQYAAKPVACVLKADEVVAGLDSVRPCTRAINVPAKFSIGERVRARNMHPVGHTRLPRYVRGHIGTVIRTHGAHVFPDTNASGLGEAPQWLYTVRFAGTELWGEAADPTVSVTVDAWESYLEQIS